MANTIQHKRSTTASSVPSAGQLAVGELALNLTDKKIYSKDGSGNVVEMSPTVVEDGSITTAKIADANVTIAKLSATGTPSSSTYLRGDGSWQAPAGGVTSLNGQTGAITDTTLYAIGGYVIGRPFNVSNYSVNATLAGSSLYSTLTGVRTVYDNNYGTSWVDPSAQSLINIGSWRCVSSAYGTGTSGGKSGWAGLWVRYA